MEKFFLALLVLSCCYHLVIGSDTTIEMVHVIFRHGHRTSEDQAMKEFPNYEEVNNTWPPFGKGQMTNEGILHMFKLGEALRKKYKDLFRDCDIGCPADEIVKTFVTEYVRTQASALAFLTGLLPPAPAQQWGKENHCDEQIEDCRGPAVANFWRPNTYIYDQHIRDMTNRWYFCPAFYDEVLRVQDQPEMRKKFSKYDRLHKIVSEQLGKPFDREQVWYIRNLYTTQEAAGFPKPKWMEDIWDEFTEYTNMIYESMFYTDKLKRFGAGEMLDQILKDSQAKADGVENFNELKMLVYSGHESIVVPLYMALAGEKGFEDLQGDKAPLDMPEFSATILVELHRSLSTGEYGFKFLYSDGNRNFKALRRSDCADPCPLEDLIRLALPITFNSTNIEAECKNTKKSN